MRHHLEEARDAQRCALIELKIPKALRKMPKPSQEQWDCTHGHLRLQANQYGRQRSCQACKLTMFYTPTALAIETARRRQSRPRTMTRPEARRLLQEQGRQRDESTSSPVPESPGSPESAESPLSLQAIEQMIQVTEQMVQTLNTRQAQTRGAMHDVLNEMMARSNEADGGDSTSSFQMVEDLVESSA